MPKGPTQTHRVDGGRRLGATRKFLKIFERMWSFLRISAAVSKVHVQKVYTGGADPGFSLRGMRKFSEF